MTFDVNKRNIFQSNTFGSSTLPIPMSFQRVGRYVIHVYCVCVPVVSSVKHMLVQIVDLHVLIFGPSERFASKFAKFLRTSVCTYARTSVGCKLHHFPHCVLLFG